MIQHEVVDLVDIEKVEIARPGRGNAHLIIEKPMAAHGLHSRIPLRAHQVLPPLVTQAHYGTV